MSAKRQLNNEWWQQERQKLEDKYDISFSRDEKRIISDEYKKYLNKKGDERRHWYIFLCQTLDRFAYIPVDEDTEKKLNNAIRLLDWNIRPRQVMTVSVLTLIVTGIPALMFFLSSFPFIFRLIGMALPFGLLYYMLYFPHLKAMEKVLKSSEDLIFSVLYMIIYTYSSPNLEGAVMFAALNLKGPIAFDLKKVLWDVEVGTYRSVEESLGDYVAKWEPYNKDFLEAVQMVRAAMLEISEERRMNFLDSASNTILNGSKERMKKYSQQLKLPVTMLNGFGVLLPILGMIALPIISAFLGDIQYYHVMLLYNVMIPGIVYFVMASVMIKRPPTASSSMIEREGSMPPAGRWHLSLGSLHANIPAILIGFLVFLGIGGWAMSHFITNGFGSTNASLPTLLRSLSVTIGAGFGISIGAFIGHKQRLRLRNGIQKIEQEFPNALFELGNRLAQEIPIEVALDGAVKSMQNMKISQFFRTIANNIRQGGMTFQQAIFDKQYGALLHYPSQLIETVMKAVLEASKRGTQVASNTMVTIASYLRNLHKTQEQIRDLMEETTTTMKFIGYVLAPVIAGVAVSMTKIIGTAIEALSSQLENLENAGGSGGAVGGGQLLPSGGGGLNVEQIIPPDLLQLIIGAYVIQILIIIGMFYSRITQGTNKDYERVFIGRLLLIGLIVYGLTATIITALFGGVVNSIL